jgi:hypothetical protein
MTRPRRFHLVVVRRPESLLHELCILTPNTSFLTIPSQPLTLTPPSTSPTGV